MLFELVLAAMIGALCFALLLRANSGRSGPRGRSQPGLRGQGAQLNRILRRRFAKRGMDRPRVMVSGPKVKPVVCQICLGRVKEGSEYSRCACGKTFHPVCLARTGFCPYCEKRYTEEALRQALVVRPKAPAGRAKGPSEIRMIWQPGMARICPLCGAELPEGSGECQCGSIIVEEGESFECPSCGTEVPADMSFCPGCKERFDVVEEPICQVCGRVIAGGKGVCDCGALTDNMCPECGAYLEPDDTVCGRCGTAFEFV